MKNSLTSPFGRKHDFWRVFLLCFLGAAVLYLPYVIVDGGLFHYAGDFNGQQINFYAYANRFIKEGGGSFSWETDLGSGFVNSYSFYLVGSPFWWLSLLIPTRLMPYCMVPMLCLKFGVAGGGAWLWMRRYTRRSDWAVLGAVLYTFSGFTLYNVFFNHFVDVIALFPYLLWALDAAVYDGRRGVLPLLVALNLLNNYFFFVGQVVFLFIYFICKWVSGEYRVTPRLFGTLAFESLLGCGLGCLLAWPAVLSLLQNPRTVDLSSGYGFLFYGDAQQYGAILTSPFLMPDVPYQMNLWDKGIIKWTSLTAYLPLMSCAGVFTWVRSRPGTAFKRILGTCVVFALVPVLNSLFYALNSSYYARWYYMPVLVMALCSVKGLEDGLDQSSGVATVLAGCAASIALAVVPVLDKETDSWSFGVVDDQPKFWLMLLVTVAGVTVFWLLVEHYAHSPRLAVILLAGVLGGTFVYGNVHIAYTKFNQWDNDKNYVQQCYREGPVLEAYFRQEEGTDSEHFFRLDAYGCYDNVSLYTNIPCIQFFNSTVAPSILSFYPELGVKRDVSSKPEQDKYALRGLLSVEYLVTPLEKEAEFLEEEAKGWVREDTVGSYAVYRNENFVPMGLTFDYYITEEQFQKVPTSNRANLLMKALLLTEEQIEAFGDILQPLPEARLTQRTYAEYEKDCAERRETACTSFRADNNGFTASVTAAGEELVLFSIPYDDGFRATVNGEPASIERVDKGLMAVRVPAGDSVIRFDFRTDGILQSGAATAVSVVVYIVYLLTAVLRRRREDAVPPPEEAGETDYPALPHKPDRDEECKSINKEDHQQ